MAEPNGRGGWRLDGGDVAEVAAASFGAACPVDHVYLSTSCLHAGGYPAGSREAAELHGYCQSGTGRGGAKVPACCKFCSAPCVCVCHSGRPAGKMPVEVRLPTWAELDLWTVEASPSALVVALTCRGCGGVITVGRDRNAIDVPISLGRLLRTIRGTNHLDGCPCPEVRS